MFQVICKKKIAFVKNFAWKYIMQKSERKSKVSVLVPISQLDVVPAWIAFYNLVCEISLICEKFTVRTKYSFYFKTIAIVF